MSNLFDFDKDYGVVIGTDEAGRGPAAGGVFAAAVYFPEVTDALITDLSRLNDSKKLSEVAREKLYDVIIKNTINSVVCIEVDEIERINILNSSLKAMKLSCESVIKEAGLKDLITLVDGNKLIKEYSYPQKYIIKGDGKSASIAAASILAKVYRDNLMIEYAKEFPEYGFEKHKGYGTKIHIEKIKEIGPCRLHRKTFIKNFWVEQEK